MYLLFYITGFVVGLGSNWFYKKLIESLEE